MPDEMGASTLMCLDNTHNGAFANWLHTFVFLLFACAGCTSIESTMVTRDETNQTWERHNCLNGVPITLKVPTHLKLYVFHTYYLQAIRETVTPDEDTEENTEEEPIARVIGVEPVCMDVVVRDFAHELMYTDKIFVVDFKRPPAGSSNLRVDMTEEQYIDEIQHDITDQTIQAVAGLLGAFTGTTPTGINVPRTVSGELKPDLKPIKSLVAVGIFEIEAPDFEQKVRQFLDCHINKSHDAWVVPPCVRNINRVGIRPSDNVQVPYPPVPLCPDGGECHPGLMKANSMHSPEHDSAGLIGPTDMSHPAPFLDMGGHEL